MASATRIIATPAHPAGDRRSYGTGIYAVGRCAGARNGLDAHVLRHRGRTVTIFTTDVGRPATHSGNWRGGSALGQRPAARGHGRGWRPTGNSARRVLERSVCCSSADGVIGRGNWSDEDGAICAAPWRGAQVSGKRYRVARQRDYAGHLAPTRARIGSGHHLWLFAPRRRDRRPLTERAPPASPAVDEPAGRCRRQGAVDQGGGGVQ